MKKYFYTLLLGGTLVLFAGAAVAETAKVPMKAVNNTGAEEEIGFITFTDTPEGLVMDVDVFDLPAGTHKLRLLDKPDCTSKAQAGGAAAVTPKAEKVTHKDGKASQPCEPPDITVGADGKAKVTHTAPGMKVSDVRNHAIVIKKAKEQHPSKRLACGEIK